MNLGTLRRLVPVLLLLGAVTVSATGCLLVPIPVGGAAATTGTRTAGRSMSHLAGAETALGARYGTSAVVISWPNRSMAV